MKVGRKTCFASTQWSISIGDLSAKLCRNGQEEE